MRTVGIIVAFVPLLLCVVAESNRDTVRREISESEVGFGDDQIFYLLYARGWYKFFDALYVLFNVSTFVDFIGRSQMTTAGCKLCLAVFPIVAGVNLLFGLLVSTMSPGELQREEPRKREVRQVTGDTPAKREASAREIEAADEGYEVHLQITFLDQALSVDRRDGLSVYIASHFAHLVTSSYAYAVGLYAYMLVVNIVHRVFGVTFRHDSYMHYMWLWMDASLLDQRDRNRLRHNTDRGVLIVIRLAQAVAAPLLWVYGAIAFGFHLLVLGIMYARGVRGQIKWFPGIHGPDQVVKAKPLTGAVVLSKDEMVALNTSIR